MIVLYFPQVFRRSSKRLNYSYTDALKFVTMFYSFLHYRNHHLLGRSFIHLRVLEEA